MQASKNSGIKVHGKAKRACIYILSAILVFFLTACSENPETGKEEQTVNSSSIEKKTSELTTDSSGYDADKSLGGTYWTAVQREAYNYDFGRTEVSKMPTEKWWADLFLNEDGTAQFREVVGDSFNNYLPDGTWWLGVDNTLRLMNHDYPEEDMNGKIEDGRIMLETAYGERFYLEKAERPKPGGELCTANLCGTWRMTQTEENGRRHNARENGMASTLLFTSGWNDFEGGEYSLTADWYSANMLDTDKPVYTQIFDLVPKVIDEPLFPGVYNEVWSVRMFDEGTDTEFCLTLTDSDTMYLQERHKHGTSELVSTLIYERVESFLPETLQSALYEEPFDSLIFYWDNPPEDVYTPLEAMPKTELEPNGSDRLLLVGRYYETQIRFCTGEGIWDDSGNLLDWVADETLYENVIENNEPHWFSMTVPEGVTNICLYIKRPWDDIWYLWPVTDTGSYTVNGWTFLTPKK